MEAVAAVGSKYRSIDFDGILKSSMLDPFALDDVGFDVARPLDGRAEVATADMICFSLVVRDLCAADTGTVSRMAA